ncbi:hypothetical protein LCGC14_2782100 [marine sediment metagenome]|uniref:Glycosyltransferase 2-like domain-containing protein n=1 Tax=marine sediment metagenome TaxID=412755 RepID=A0A0F8YSZ4_9ZZZZ
MISLVIPTFNRLMKLFRLLKSLNILKPKPNEIIIIDDNSTDQTPELLKRWRERTNGFKKKIIFKSQNKGPAYSRNIGIKRAYHDLVAFLDDDVAVTPPSEPSINIKKSNKIPEWTDFLEENIRSHIQLCLSHKDHPLIRNDLKYYYYNIMKNRDLDVIDRENALIEEEIISFLKSERKKRLEIIPGRIFNPTENETEEDINP